MKTLKIVSLAAVFAGFIAAPFLLSAADAGKKPEPYPLKMCIVSGEKLGGDMGDPYVFIWGATNGLPGREIKLCCKSCLEDFTNAPAKFIKKIDEAAAKQSAPKPFKGSL